MEAWLVSGQTDRIRCVSVPKVCVCLSHVCVCLSHVCVSVPCVCVCPICVCLSHMCVSVPCAFLFILQFSYLPPPKGEQKAAGGGLFASPSKNSKGHGDLVLSSIPNLWWCKHSKRTSQKHRLHINGKIYLFGNFSADLKYPSEIFKTMVILSCPQVQIFNVIFPKKITTNQKERYLYFLDLFDSI